MMIFIFIAIFLCLLAFHVIFRCNKKAKLVDKIPGPFPLPVLGNILQFKGSAENLWNVLSQTINQYYPIARVWRPTTAMVLTCDPDDYEILLSSSVNVDKGSMYVLLKSWFQDGVIVTKGEKWQYRRKLATPAFHLDNLKKNVEVANKYGKKLIEYLKSHGNESIHNLLPLSADTLLHVFCDASLDVQLENIKPDIIKKYKEAIPVMFSIGAYRVTRPYIMDWMMPFLKIGRMEKKYAKDIHNLRTELIKERKDFHERTKYQYLKEFVDDSNEDILTERKIKPTMLDLFLLAERKGLIDKQGIEEEIDNYLAAGHETAGVSIVYALMLLAENKEIQDLARTEVMKILDQTGGEITMAEVQKLDYVERCMKESLRLYPGAPLFVRYIKEDIQLKNYLVPAGYDILCMAFNTHRDPKIWSEPNKFDPDRFLPENLKNRHPFAYIPFSAGPRNCIGRKLAMVQMKVLVALILYNFYLEPVDLTADLKFYLNITLHPTNPVQRIKFIKINKK